MKLLFVTNLFPPHVVGGYEIGCLMNASAAARAGHEVRVVTSIAFGSLVRQSQAHGLDVRPVFQPVLDYEKGERFYRRPGDFAGIGGIVPGNCAALAEAIRGWRPDAVWIHNPLGLGPVGILETAVAGDAPVILHLMDDLDEGVEDAQNGFELTGRWAAAKARTHAIACSQRVLRENSRLGGFASAEVIPGGVDAAVVAQSGAGLRRPWRRGETVRMVSFGQITSKKGVQHVVAALGLLRSSMGLDVELHLVGRCEAEFAAELRGIASAARCLEAVHWHGQRKQRDLHDLLSTMHLAVLPLNEDEAFGYVAPEAALHGMCVAIGPAAGCVDVFPEGYPYVLPARDDPTAIAATVQRMIVCDEERRTWEARIAADVAATCDLDGVVLPRCLAFIGGAVAARRRDRNAMVLPMGDGEVESSLAAWQMNRNLAILLDDAGDSPATVSRRLGRRIERALRGMVPPAARYRLRSLASALRRRAG